MACRREGRLFLRAYYFTTRMRTGLVAATLVVTLNPLFNFARLYSRAELFSVPVPQLYFRRRHVYRSLSLASDLDAFVVIYVPARAIYYDTIIALT